MSNLWVQVESSVRLLQLVSVVAEAAGERLQPNLGALAAALPQVGDKETCFEQTVCSLYPWLGREQEMKTEISILQP
jgi:hypothetical protein